MGEMIERMARAAQTAYHGWAPGTKSESWQNWIPAMRAAIEAMREPDRAMKDAALAALNNATVEEPKAAAWDAVQAYRAMIDAALAK